MRLKNFFVICLILESALVLAGLLMKRDVWIGVTCYWAVQLMKNINDCLDEKRTSHG